MNKVDLIEKFEQDLNHFIAEAHRSGLDYWTVLRVCLLRCVDLMMQSQAEYYIKGGR